MKKIFALLLLSFCVQAQELPAFLNHHNKVWVDSLMKELSLDEKIGQLFMPRGNTSGKAYQPEKLMQWVKDYKIGGLVMFAGKPTEQAKLINDLQANSKTPLLIGMDLEWGLAMRLDSTVRFPYSMTLGAMQGNTDLIEAMGVEVGKQCRRMGVHVNYAPVVDINNNPNNPVINFRSFGENKEAVTQKALAYMRGMQKENILTSAKHFPGHGDTGVDSHYDLPLISHSKKHLEELELYPYKELIKAGLSGVMVAHLSIPALDTTKNLASTLSENIVTDLLRKDLGFQGLIFTDAMDMQGAVKFFPEGTANVKAILAGNDILETFEDVHTAFNAIKKAIENKEISVEELDIRVRRILMAKSWVGLDKYKPIETKDLIKDLNTIEADVLNRHFAEKTLTLLKNENDILPIQDLSQRIASVSIDAESNSVFQNMAGNYTNITHYQIPQKASDSHIAFVTNQLDKNDLILVGLHLQNIRPSAKYGITETNKKALKVILETGKAVLVIFGNPYCLDKLDGLEQARAIVLANQLTNYTEDAAAQALFGAIPISGKLPVSVNKKYSSGLGIDTKSIGRLAYTVPEMVGIPRQKLQSKIDSVVNLGLEKKAYPTCVVQIAKDGKVIFRKTYLPLIPSEGGGNSLPFGAAAVAEGWGGAGAIYDLASITKISTSMLAVMQLMSEGKFDLDKTLGDYYPEWKNSNKGNLRFRDMLTHRAGLKAWIPFWLDCIDSVATVQASPVFKEKYASDFKTTFFERLFSAKKCKAKLMTAIKTNKTLWQECLEPENLIWKSNTFSSSPSADFPQQVSDNLWQHKNYAAKVYEAIKDSPVSEKKDYLYSDLHYYLYPIFMEQLTGMKWEDYLKKTYQSLGASTLTYNPLRFYSKEQIAQTEIDTYFRKGLIHGRVHDEGAAMLNGISGHAGLFGNANDLMKLTQMYLQKGSFGGKQYIKPEIIAECTKYQFPAQKNRRGIGFDKPDFNLKTGNAPASASAQSFGHSGFTGTFTWADPANGLNYVFLSNRVYPTRNNNKISELNIRTEVLEQVYQLLK